MGCIPFSHAKNLASIAVLVKTLCRIFIVFLSAPKPPGQPQKLAVRSVERQNGTFRGQLTWEAPVSDLPIQRYKVFWSRRLQAAGSSHVSLLVNHQTVPGVRNIFSVLQRVQPFIIKAYAVSQLMIIWHFQGLTACKEFSVYAVYGYDYRAFHF